MAAVLGFGPTRAVTVSTGCNREIDHVATALLTAAVMDVIARGPSGKGQVWAPRARCPGG
ncbi:DUF6368 family protein [Streptomyces sp. NPDC002405]|uniref:DUF6368 family protein n=1 Tax=Streptomyces sp. NPDC057596 TaxID=3346178 RepID=UPI003690C512